MKIIQDIKISLIKANARSAYLAYQRARDSMDCGHAIAMQFSSVSEPAYKFDDLLDQLEKLGELDVPKTRLTR